MKKFLKLFIVISALFCVNSFALDDEYGGIGTLIRKDKNKTFIIKVFDNSPASKANLKATSEIIEVDNVKTKKIPLEEISYRIRGKIGTKVTLLIKENGKKREISIEREKVSIQTSKDEKYNLHWKQIAPQNYSSLGYFYNSKYYSASLNNHIDILNYWAKREEVFKVGYNSCMTYPKNDQSVCLINLVNREMQKTANDRQEQLQEEALRQQAAQNFTNTMNQIQMNSTLNSINNTLRH